MGRKSKILGSNKLSKMKDEQKFKAKKKRIVSVLVCEAVVACTAVTVPFIVFNKFKSKCIELPKWDDIGIGENEISLNDIDGLIGMEEYCDYRLKESLEDIESSRKVLGDKVANWYIDGANSEYFHYSCIMDYSKLQDRIAELEKTGDILNALVERCEFKKDYSGCHEDDCEFNEYINNLTNGKLQEKLVSVHQNYENLLEYYIEKTELNDSDLEYLYESELISNFDYIESIDVEIVPINPKLLKHGIKAIDAAYRDNLVYKQTLTEKDIESLKSLPLYTSQNFWDEELLKRAGSLMQSVFSTASGIETSDNAIVNITDIEDKEEWIKSIKPPTSSKEEDKLSNRNYVNFNLTGYNSNDNLLVTYKVNNVKRKELPDKEDITSDIGKVNELKLYLAKQSLNSDIALVKDKMAEQSNNE